MSADSPSKKAPVIEMSGVTVGSLRDQERIVTADVNWRVMPGEYWVVAGMHGSGKTDFINLTAGLMPPREGCYRLFGHEMPIFEEELLKERLRLGLVFDGGNLFHHLTVAENISLPLRYHRQENAEEINRRVESMLEVTGLGPWANSTPGNLGRDWQRRAGLARALILEPEILLLDNPLGGLDLRHGNWWLNFLGQLSSGHDITGGRPMTLVVTAGDLRPWKSRATHFAILQKQRFVLLGQREGLAGNTETIVKEFLEETVPGG